MKKLLFILFLTLSLSSNSQIVYTNPGGTINTCSGNFFDTGADAGTFNYASNENIVTTFCSSESNQIAIEFLGVDIENGFDYLYIYDGPSTASTLLWTITGTFNPGVIVSSGTCLTFEFISDGTVTAPGWSAIISCIYPTIYTMPTAGINGEYVGSCLVTDCGPFTFTDDGGPTNFYSNSIGTNCGVVGGSCGIYRTFCPNTAGQCMEVTFNSFLMSNNFDYLQVKNGPTQNSNQILSLPNSATAYTGINGLTGDLRAEVPFSFTSTDASGCLTFRNFTSSVNNTSGWSATLKCVPCAGGPTGTENNDCQNYTAICSNATINSTSSGPGISAEGCTGSACPAGGEHHTNWYKFKAATTGFLSLTITPNAGGDYDFAIYGPNVTCGSLGDPIRCTDSGITGNTGLDNSLAFPLDVTEPASGDSWLAELLVNAGEEFYLVVDEWSPNSAGGYSMSWAGSSASLDCIILPVELSEFNTEYNPELGVVDVFWATESERNNDYFLVERSVNGTDYEVINKVKGAGNTQYETQYYVEDPNPFVGVNYYRLKQVDFDGEFKYSEVRSVNILDDAYDLMSVFPNPAENVTEVIFNSYDNHGAMLKLVKMDGTVIINTPVETQRGGNHIKVDLSEQESGIYFVVITTDKKVYTEKLVIR